MVADAASVCHNSGELEIGRGRRLRERRQRQRQRIVRTGDPSAMSRRRWNRLESDYSEVAMEEEQALPEHLGCKEHSWTSSTLT